MFVTLLKDKLLFQGFSVMFHLLSTTIIPWYLILLLFCQKHLILVIAKIPMENSQVLLYSLIQYTCFSFIYGKPGNFTGFPCLQQQNEKGQICLQVQETWEKCVFPMKWRRRLGHLSNERQLSVNTYSCPCPPQLHNYLHIYPSIHTTVFLNGTQCHGIWLPYAFHSTEQIPIGVSGEYKISVPGLATVAWFSGIHGKVFHMFAWGYLTCYDGLNPTVNRLCLLLYIFFYIYPFFTRQHSTSTNYKHLDRFDLI